MSNPLLNNRSLGLGNLDRADHSPWSPPVLDDQISRWDKGVMTVAGTANAAVMLLVLVLASATVTWFALPDPAVSFPTGLVLGAALLGLAIALVATFKPRTARVLAPVYALVEGVVLGAVSRAFESQYDGIVLQAVGATLAVFTTMLLLYRSKVVRVTEKFRRVVVGATLGLLVFYGVSMLLALFGAAPSFISAPTPLGIVFSIFVAGLAAFNLALDFDLIERAAQDRQPAYMEWYCALALTITLVWLYLEILRLLAKLRQD
jgi:uncharacterized YccA/Bax inhibitor family protein